MQTRVCCNCRIEKPLVAFHRRPDRPGGRQYACRTCVSNKSAVERWKPPALSDAEAGYIAGLIDGEGSISLLNGRWLQLRIYNSHLGMLNWVKATVGGIVCRGKTPPSAKHKQGYFWVLSMRRAVPFLGIVLRYLIIKRRHAEIAVAFYERIWRAKDEARDDGRSVGSTANDHVALELHAELKSLNRRGPRPDLDPSP